MSYRLPPLNALRAFEAAARHRSFKDAANELNVTPGAVGQQVRTLEEFLGVTLFHRLHKSLDLTATARVYLPDLSKAFRIMSDATDAVTPTRPGTQLIIGVDRWFAETWLMPRLHRLLDADPALDVRVTLDTSLEDIREGHVDAVIRPDVGPQPGFENEIVFEDRWIPVCAPSLQTGQRRLRAPSDLVEHVLLHEPGKERWRRWLARYDVSEVDPARGPSFSDEQLLLEAAKAGQGVALVRSLAARSALNSGALVMPFHLSISDHCPFHLIYLQATRDCSGMAAFRSWMAEEVSESAPDSDGKAGIRVDGMS
jgi:LysR family glycine cleavage system transcriptional activator